MPKERIWLAVQYFMATSERSARMCRTSMSYARIRPSHIANTNGGLSPLSGLSFKREGRTGAVNAGPPSNSGTSTTKIHQSKNSITASLRSKAASSVALCGLLMSYQNRTKKGRNHHTRAILLSIPHPSISRHCQHFPLMARSTIPLILILTSNKVFKV